MGEEGHCGLLFFLINFALYNIIHLTEQQRYIMTDYTGNFINTLSPHMKDRLKERANDKDNERHEYLTVNDIVAMGAPAVQGYYGLLSPFYFDGDATDLDIALEEINVWHDVVLNVDAQGTFDYRPIVMKDAQETGYTGTGASGDPIVFDLEGLSIASTASVRASMSFNPDDDGGKLESRILFNRHSGTTPSADFAIEEVSLSMESGAQVDYVAEPHLTFFVGDTIDTNAEGDAGKVRFQVKTDVPGTLSLRALTLYIQK